MRAVPVQLRGPPLLALLSLEVAPELVPHPIEDVEVLLAAWKDVRIGDGLAAIAPRTVLLDSQDVAPVPCEVIPQASLIWYRLHARTPGTGFSTASTTLLTRGGL